jgi:signal transduction histidine kinase
MLRRATNVLAWLGLAGPALGLAVNRLWPPSRYGYEIELVLLISLWFVSWELWERSVKAAVLFYCCAALVPVGMMLHYYASIGGDFSALALTPLLGIAIVAVMTLDERAIIVYGFATLVASLVFGFISGDVGQGGALAFLCAALACVATWGAQAYNLKAYLAEINKRQENIDRGLNRITGELNR